MRLLGSALLAFFVGAMIGLSLPDTDRGFFFLTHRSIITHSVLVPGLAFWLVREKAHWLKMGVAGLAMAVAIHLSFDMFPNAWRGYALLHVPLLGYQAATASMLWFLLNMAACCYLALLLTMHRRLLEVLVLGAACLFIFAAGKERSFLMPLLTLLITVGIATLLPNPVIRGQNVLRRWMAASSLK